MKVNKTMILSISMALPLLLFTSAPTCQLACLGKAAAEAVACGPNGACLAGVAEQLHDCLTSCH